MVGTKLCAQAEVLEEYSDPKAADDWMQKWITSIPSDRNAKGMLFLGRFADPTYFITKEIAWRPEADKADEYSEIRVPAGFVTDFASIPRLFWSIVRPDGEYGYAAIVHDYLYWEQPIAKDKADNVFRFLMEDFKVDRIKVSAIYQAVKLGGRSAWNDNAKRRQNGEKRILKRFPDEPTVRWEEWKRRDDVF